MAARRPSLPRRVLERLRFRSHSGRLIRRHRALRRLDFERASILHPAILVAVSYGVLLPGQSHLAAAWESSLRFWLPRLGLPVETASRSRELLGYTIYEVPFPLLDGSLPDRAALLGTAGACGGLMLLSYLLLRGRALPAAYLVWAACTIVLSSCVALWLAPERFPYTIASHVANGLEFALLLMLVMPLLLTFSYYVFDHSLARKALGTALLLGGIAVIAPYQYLAHAALIESFSLLVMPLLYVLFGLLLDIAVFVALYAWVISWEP